MSLRPALAGLLLAAALAPTAARPADGLYLKALGGAAFVLDDDLDVSDPEITFDYDFDTGYVLGAALGVEITPALAVEAEYAYRNARADVHGAIRDFGPEPIIDDWTFRETVTAQSAMVNLVYRFPPTLPLRPYAGAGLGGAVVDFGGDDSDLGFAWQAFAGAAYDLSPRWSLSGEVRWFHADGGRIIDIPGYRVDGGLESVDLLVGLAYRFP